MKKLSVALLAIAVASLAGCASNGSGFKGVADIERPYDPSMSRAGNIGALFGYERLKDFEVPKMTGDGSHINTAIFNSALLHWGTTQGVSIGTLDWTGVGIDVLQAVFEPTAFEDKDSYFGYLPVSKAKESTQAVTAFQNQFVQATRKAVKDLKGNYRIEVSSYEWSNGEDVPWIVRSKLRSRSTFIFFVNEGKNCYSGQVKDKPHCFVDIRHVYPQSPTTISPTISARKEVAWKFEPKSLHEKDHVSTLTWQVSADSQFDFNKYEVYAAIAKHLPKYAYIYVSPKRVDGKTMPPMILEKEKGLLFVKPN